MCIYRYTYNFLFGRRPTGMGGNLMDYLVFTTEFLSASIPGASPYRTRSVEMPTCTLSDSQNSSL